MNVASTGTSHTGTRPSLLSRIILLAFACDPIVVHLAVYSGATWWALAYLALVGVLAGIQCWLQKRWLWLAVVAGILLVFAYFWRHGNTDWFIFIPPVAIFAALAFVFGRTLISGQTALITRIAMVMAENGISEAEKNYTRNITLVWAVFFCVMGLESILLAMFASLQVWSTMTNFINYILVAVMFVIEFIVRKRVLKEDGFSSFFHFIASMLKKRKEIRRNVF